MVREQPSGHFLTYFVRLTGLEPAQPKLPDPKSGASTSSATGALPRHMILQNDIAPLEAINKTLCVAFEARS